MKEGDRLYRVYINETERATSFTGDDGWQYAAEAFGQRPHLQAFRVTEVSSTETGASLVRYQDVGEVEGVKTVLEHELARWGLAPTPIKAWELYRDKCSAVRRDAEGERNKANVRSSTADRLFNEANKAINRVQFEIASFGGPIERDHALRIERRVILTLGQYESFWKEEIAEQAQVTKAEFTWFFEHATDSGKPMVVPYGALSLNRYELSMVGLDRFRELLPTLDCEDISAYMAHVAACVEQYRKLIVRPRLEKLLEKANAQLAPDRVTFVDEFRLFKLWPDGSTTFWKNLHDLYAYVLVDDAQPGDYPSAKYDAILAKAPELRAFCRLHAAASAFEVPPVMPAEVSPDAT